MKYCLCAIMLIFSQNIFADTIINYMTIANNIPQMELKPDEQSLAWAHSARQILATTDETIAETLVLMNAAATKHNAPLFCLPDKTVISPEMMDTIIKKTYTTLSQTGTNVQQMAVSEVAMVGMIKTYPCAG